MLIYLLIDLLQMDDLELLDNDECIPGSSIDMVSFFSFFQVEVHCISRNSDPKKIFFFLRQDPDGVKAKEEAGTVRRALEKVALSFDSVELGVKHLICKQERETGSPKGICWLCVKCC